jgi:SRSO17 transposase
MELENRAVEDRFAELANKLKKEFANGAGFMNMQNYLRGLLGDSERKNGWQLSEYVGKSTPYALQQFIYRGRFSSDGLRDVLLEYVGENLGDENGILVVDETGFLKQGKHSCGVKRQYSGTAGRIENCQIGVFLTYASTKGHSPIDRRLYMPKEWVDDPERRKKAGVPEDLTFQTKPQMALEMIQNVTASKIPYSWVTGDCVYGDYTDIRMWLEENHKNYVLSVSGKSYVWMGIEHKSVKSVIESLPEDDWFEMSCGNGSKGARMYDWQKVAINPGTTDGFERCLLVRRSKTAPNEVRAYICFAANDMAIEKLVEVAGYRWTVETCFKESKSYVGLDHYEVRSYEGWYKHITLSCVALAFLTVLSSTSLDTLSLQEHDPGSKSLEEFKKGRNLRV